ncbi:MAG TPA: COX15/CtaA family protein, partial [Solirubrobacteraceae bacterium]|nr:COX15/CtaA family protein [Solirubrobacteraceae bacterium]
MFARARERWPISAETYEKIALAALASLVLVVLTGAAVRLTGSGLGCPTWPRCTRTSLQPQLNSYALIEFGNRVLIFFVSAAALLAVVGALLRRPAERRRDLMWLSWLLPLGIVGQAVIGGESVLHKLAPGWVMSHYWLSMVILVAAFELWWRARLEPEELGRPGADRTTILAVRAITLVAVVVIVLGSAATAAGPHAGASGTGQLVQ